MPSNISVFFFFLSDCTPSTAVANTLYCGGNKICLCARPGSGLELGRWGNASLAVGVTSVRVSPPANSFSRL